MIDFGYLRHPPEEQDDPPFLPADGERAYASGSSGKTLIREMPMPVLDQGPSPGCVINAVAQQARYLWWRKGIANPPMPSRLYLGYNARKLRRMEGVRTGHYPKDVYTALDRGFPPEESWPYDLTKYTVQPGASAYKDSYERSSEARERLGLGKLRWRRISSSRVKNVKQAIDEDKTVGVGLVIDEGFQRYRKGDGTWTFRGLGQGEHYGILGEYRHDGAWFLSSWGPAWGDDGGIWVSWEDLEGAGAYDFFVLDEIPTL